MEKKFYTEHEEEKLRNELKCNTANRFKENCFLILVILCAIVAGLCLSSFNHQPNPSPQADLFPETWTCGNCGYSNYVTFDTCAVCGTSR